MSGMVDAFPPPDAAGDAMDDEDEVRLSADANKLFRVFKTVNIMLHKRGFIIDESDKNMTKKVGQRWGM